MNLIEGAAKSSNFGQQQRLSQQIGKGRTDKMNRTTLHNFRRGLLWITIYF